MESIQTAKETKTPRYSRAVSWLGGASFGRAPKRETPETPHALYGTAPLIFLDAALVATFALRNVIGPWPCIAAAAGIIFLSVLWLRRFNDTTVPFFRWAACAVLTIQLFLFLPIYVLMLLHGSISVSTL
jgi:hypothetical protein